MKRIVYMMAVVLTACLPLSTSASAGTYKTITIDGDYSDWTGVPVLDSDGGDNTSGPDIGDTQVANDGQYLYIRNTFANSLSLGTFITVDVDQDPTTGFDVFGLGLVGSEAGWQNDFPFTQATGTFNDGVGMNGDFFGSGAALLDSFTDGPSRELAISLDIMRNGDGPIFPGNTIRFLVWTDKGTGADGLPTGFPGDDGLNYDVSSVIDYTLAVPEPASLGLCAMASLGLLLSRRRLV